MCHIQNKFKELTCFPWSWTRPQHIACGQQLNHPYMNTPTQWETQIRDWLHLCSDGKSCSPSQLLPNVTYPQPPHIPDPPPQNTLTHRIPSPYQKLQQSQSQTQLNFSDPHLTCLRSPSTRHCRCRSSGGAHIPPH